MKTKPKIAFLIPIASAQSVKDWHLFCTFLKQTLGSIFNSSNKDFCVVVAGHEAPDFDLPKDERFKFLSLNHPVIKRSERTLVKSVQDKMIKLAAAWGCAKSEWNPEYVMRFDGDDLVSSELVEYVACAKPEAGFYIRQGWLWNTGSRYLIQGTEWFDRLCGSCLIIRADLADCTGPFLNTLEGAILDAQGRVFEAKNNCSLVPGALSGTLLLNDSHGRAEAQFQYLGHQLATVPFKASVYRMQNPQSLTGRGNEFISLRYFLGKLRRTRLITPKLKKEFMLP